MYSAAFVAKETVNAYLEHQSILPFVLPNMMLNDYATAVVVIVLVVVLVLAVVEHNITVNVFLVWHPLALT